MLPIILLSTFGVVAAILVIWVISLRRVVSPNEVHIVQNARKTLSFGKDTENGNVYYEWPSWLPVFGIYKTVLPVSVFDLSFNSYEAYDVQRVPFVVDIVSFFRVDDSNLAAQRVENFSELREQLIAIVRGAIRAILASHPIDEIMLERTKFSAQFTEAVEEQLRSWGVITVKNIELMDIRDASDSKVVHNIMEKKKSLIEMESRIEVANNKKSAQIAEIDAERDTETQRQKALQAVGQQEARAEQEVGVAKQQSQQAIKDQERLTKEKEMDVVRTEQVMQAEINKEANLIKAQQDKEIVVVTAEGQLESKKRESDGIAVEGVAKAGAEKAMQLAPIQAQIELAKEIGENERYQQYLVTIRQVEANQTVGIAQAKALEKADVKIITNTGEPISGVDSVMQLFTPKGGTSIGGMLEALNQTEAGKSIISKFSGKSEQ